MSNPTPPNDPWNELAQTLGKLVGAVQKSSQIMHIQAAMAWIFMSDLERSRASLDQIPTEILAEVPIAATALASLAEDLLSERSLNGKD